ncbi:hypothetical protein EDC04DRAFT_2616630 [Pisolithus marmoratus]|nr:hypothetical protein EDC04DRAFT_2616630 [Pisolithus marmoratus]
MALPTPPSTLTVTETSDCLARVLRGLSKNNILYLRPVPRAMYLPRDTSKARAGEALVDGVCLDLARALVEPDTVMIPKDGNLLPFPKRSPKKSKIGMSVAQVKLAHDLCTAPHMGLQLFSDIFTSSAKYQLFGKAQLRDMLTHVLAIPMDEALPTPNARKACALSIWLPQVQRLAAKFLLPAKRGKKGLLVMVSKPRSVTIPTLYLRPCSRRTSSFNIIESACAYTDTTNTSMPLLWEAATFLTTSTSSPPLYNTLRSKPLIVRTLRSTLSAADPTHVAHGPMWVLSVLASFIVLLGPKVCADVKLTRVRYIALAYMRPASEIRTHYAKQDNDWAIELVKSMIQKGSQACENGMEIVTIFVCFENTGQSWTLNKFLPHSLFSSNPGLLTVEYSGLSSVVKPIFDECSQLTDVRSLTREELSQDWVFDELIELWKIALRCLWMTEKYDLPFGITGLMKANVAFLLDVGDHDGTVSFGARAANLLVDILGNYTLDFTSAAWVPSPPPSTPGAYYQDEEALTEQQTEPYEGTPEKDRIIPPAAAFIRSSVAFPSSTENDLEDELAVEASLVTPVVVPPLADVRRQWQLQRRASTEDVVSPTSLLPYLTLSLPHLRGSDSDTLLQTRAKRLKRMEDAELSDTSLRSSLKALEDIVISSRKW